MIWKDPIYKKRPATLWLDPVTGFHPGTAALVESSESAPLKKGFLRGHLIRLTGDRRGVEDAVVGVLARLKDHADQAIYLKASQVLTLQREREDHPATGLMIGATLEEVDVVVIGGLQALTEHQVPVFDGLLSVRGGPVPPRITILIEPNPGFCSTINLPATLEEYGSRVIGG